MITTKENPYRPPSGKSSSSSPSRLSVRLKCPVCNVQTVPYWTLYCVGQMFPVQCPNCHTKLKVAKFGFGRWSSFILAIPCAMIGAVVTIALLDPDFRSLLGDFDKYATLRTFFIVLAATLAFDYFVDKHYVYVRNLRDAQQ